MLQHQGPCPACVKLKRKGSMVRRRTAYDGRGDADITYRCERCGYVAQQHEANVPHDMSGYNTAR